MTRITMSQSARDGAMSRYCTVRLRGRAPAPTKTDKEFRHSSEIAGEPAVQNRGMTTLVRVVLTVCFLSATSSAWAQTGSVTGTVTDETGGVLPGVTVDLKPSNGEGVEAVTDGQGTYRFENVPV